MIKGKQSKSKNYTSNKKGISKQELSSLESKLLECAKKGKPVLLYGKDDFGRKDLVRRIHIKNGGIDSPWEYFDCGGKIQSEEYFNNEMLKVIKDGDSKRVQELLDNCRSTVKTWMRLNCASKQGDEVFSELYSAQMFSSDRTEIMDYLVYKSDPNDHEYDPVINFTNMGGGLAIFGREGLLFIDNLSYYKGDKQVYERIAIDIEEGDKDTTSGNWLICYADNIDNFPKYFREQFKEISLDGEGAVVEPEKDVGRPRVEKRKKRKLRIPDKKFKQLCKDVEKQYCTRASGEITFFKKLSEISKLAEYDKTCRGYTRITAKKRYYEVFSSTKNK